MATATNAQILNGLYAAIYVRSPDKAGYDYWMAGFTAGTLTPGGAATAFATRSEWATAYPATLTDAAYVDKIYLNVLGIAGDAGGRAFWTANITAGAYTRAVFVSEFIAATIQYDSVADTTSTAAEKASAVQAQNAINSKVSFNDAWVANTAVSTNSALTGVSTDATGAAIYTASVDKSVGLLAGVTDAASLATQLPKIAEAANAGTALTLTTGADNLATATATVKGFTAQNETVTGPDGSLNSSDILLDTTTTDADVLTVGGVAVGTKPTTMQNIETVNITGSTSTGLDLSSTTGTKVLNLATNTTGTATVTNAKVGAAASIVAGTNITGLTVSAAATGTGGDLAVNSGTATTVTLTAAAAGVFDSFALTTTGDVTIKAGASMALETLKLTANPVAAPAGTGTATAATKAPVVTLDSASQLMTFTPEVLPSLGKAGVPASGGTIQIVSTGDLELKADIGAISGRTVTQGAGKLTLTLSGTASTPQDLSNVTATTINLGTDLGAAATVNLLDNRTISTLVDQTGLVIGNAGVSTVNNQAATFNSLSSTSLKTLTLNSAAPGVTGVDATYNTLDLAGAVVAAPVAPATTPVAAPAGGNFAGTKVSFTGGATATPQDVKVTTGKVETVDASALVGTIDYTHSNLVGAVDAATATFMDKFTFTGSAGADKLAIEKPATATNLVSKATITATLGDGDDTVTLPAMNFVTSSVIKIDGGLGSGDTLILKDTADVSQANLTLTGMENIGFDVAGGKITMSAAQVSGATYAIKGSSALTDNFVVKSLPTTTAVDLTKLVFDGTVEKITIDGSAANGAQTLAGINSLALTTVKNVITGGKGNDTITGGVAGDVIRGGLGLDSLKGNLGGDTFEFVVGDSTAAGFDTITDFKVIEGDKVSIVDAAGLAITVKNIALATTSVTAGTGTGTGTAFTGKAAVDPNSIATFTGLTDQTFAGHVAAVTNALAANEAAVWQEGANTFLLVKGATTADDILVNVGAVGSVKLADVVTGVTAVNTAPTSGDDVVTGTVGDDTTAQLSNSTAYGLDGQAGNDKIYALEGNDGMAGGLGNDTLDGGAGDDTINGGAGDDSIIGGSGADSITGGSGNDTMTGGAGADEFILTAGSTDTTTITDYNKTESDSFSTNLTAAGKLNITMTNTDAQTLDLSTLLGSAGGVATVTGSASNDTITVGAGADSVSGMAGDDTIVTDAGNDSITAGEGADVITGGAGNDSIDLTETTAAIDTVIFSAYASSANGIDTITGFAAGTGVDLVKLVAASTSTTNAAQASAGIADFAASTNVTLVSTAAAFALTTGSTTADDIIEITATLSTNGTLSATATDGTELLKALSSTTTASTGLTVDTEGDNFYAIAYQNGNAYLYEINEGAGTKLAVAADIHLVGVFNGIAANAFATGDFTV